METDLLANIALRRSAKPALAPTMCYVRDLDISDKAELENPPEQGFSNDYGALNGGIKKIRHTHHLLAMVLAEGANTQRASALTGYAPGTIYSLSNDPQFRDLIEHYKSATMAEYEELKRRAASLGMSFLDELQARFEESPEEFGNGELMKNATALLDRTILPSKVSSAAAPSSTRGPTTLRVEFVEAKQQLPDTLAPNHTIDVTAIELSNQEKDE